MYSKNYYNSKVWFAFYDLNEELGKYPRYHGVETYALCT